MNKANAFRLGRFGAAEAHLFQFVGFTEAVGEPDPIRLIAATSLLEAVAFLTKAEPDFRVRSVVHQGVVAMLSGSPHS